MSTCKGRVRWQTRWKGHLTNLQEEYCQHALSPRHRCTTMHSMSCIACSRRTVCSTEVHAQQPAAPDPPGQHRSHSWPGPHTAHPPTRWSAAQRERGELGLELFSGLVVQGGWWGAHSARMRWPAVPQAGPAACCVCWGATHLEHAEYPKEDQELGGRGHIAHHPVGNEAEGLRHKGRCACSGFVCGSIRVLMGASRKTNFPQHSSMLSSTPLNGKVNGNVITATRHALRAHTFNQTHAK